MKALRFIQKKQSQREECKMITQRQLAEMSDAELRQAKAVFNGYLSRIVEKRTNKRRMIAKTQIEKGE